MQIKIATPESARNIVRTRICLDARVCDVCIVGHMVAVVFGIYTPNSASSSEVNQRWCGKNTREIYERHALVDATTAQSH